MFGFFRILRTTICGLMLLSSVGVYASAASDLRLTEPLSKELKVYAVSSETVELQLKQGEYLVGIPKELFNEEGSALAKDYSYSLPSEKLTESQKSQKALQVTAEDGQRYLLAAESLFKLVLPANYKITIPKGTKLSKPAGAAPEKFALVEDLRVAVTPPPHSQATWMIAAQTMVERIPQPGLSSLGATLQVEPKQAPEGEHITLVITKRESDFSKARFEVGLRQPGKEPTIQPFIASEDVELKKVQAGEATVRARIPQMKEMGGIHIPTPVDLLVVARGPGNAIIADVLTQEFSVSSRLLAVIWWIAAFVLPWLVAGYISARQDPNIWFRLNPIWFVSGKYGSASLSLAQVLLWTILIFSASFYVWAASGKLLDFTGSVLTLLGIAGGSSLIAKISASAKDEKGREIAELELSKQVAAAKPEPKWLDLIKTEGRPDIYKFQMALFTTLAAVFVTGKIYGTLEFPPLPEGLVTLIGISNGIYLAAKGTSTTVFQKLAETHEEVQKAKGDFEKRKAEADEAALLLQKAETGKTDPNTKLNALTEQWQQEQDAGKKEKLKQEVEQQKTAFSEVDKRCQEAAKKKEEAEKAKKDAEKRLADLQEELKKRLDEATKEAAQKN
jgi:hypothetical protein